MTWHETHLRWQAMREIEDAINNGPAGVLPWNERYEQIFHTRDHLIRALEYRWRLVGQAQLDPELPEEVLVETLRTITAEHAPLLAVLEAYASRERTIADEVDGEVRVDVNV